MKSGLQRSIATRIWALILACSLLSALSVPAIQIKKDCRCCAAPANGCAGGMNGCGMRGIPGPLPNDLGIQPFVPESTGFLPPFIPPGAPAFKAAAVSGNLIPAGIIRIVPPELRLGSALWSHAPPAD
jgi:hypothetical protein